ncbi:RNA polymerase sigma factor [Actinomadura parmotrematis]|uniref:RNA polymerase sigma factor n=1 Tax=Actinomadura parmotrematis TaxID=2864039 RepID=A0ABS7G172_9ACTN|nr:sigma-70 family RNA polymerase sigma factor [Actinomadura parmotrematis]MBW8486422.1 RNA polymerase sigma factor [Actinomadura parmotrematis]
MAGGPDGPRLAAALRGGDVIALSEVYDAYAPRLYDYCHGLMGDRVEANGALRNTLLAAREHVGGLADVSRLRGWLYALARKECLRRRDSPVRHTGQEAPEAGGADLGEERRADLDERRVLAHSALAALSGREREALDLAVRHGLDAADVAGVLGTSPHEAAALLDGAVRALGEAAAAVAVARAHADGCASLAALSGTWPVPPASARRLPGHVDGCPACREHRAPAPAPARLLAALPVAAIPADLRLDVLSAATAGDRADQRRAVADLAGPLDAAGWPLPYAAGPAAARPGGRRRGRLLAAAGGGAAAVAIIGASLTVLHGGASTRTAASSPSAPRTPDGAVPVIAAPSAAPSAPRRKREPSASPTPTPTPTPTSASPSPTRTAEPTRKASTAPVTPSAPATTSAPPAGRIAVTGCAMEFASSCAVTVRAVGGTVTWRVAATSSGLVAGGAGTLAAGQSARVTVQRTSTYCRGGRSGQVVFTPGAAALVSWC